MISRQFHLFMHTNFFIMYICDYEKAFDRSRLFSRGEYWYLIYLKYAIIVNKTNPWNIILTYYMRFMKIYFRASFWLAKNSQIVFVKSTRRTGHVWLACNCHQSMQIPPRACLGVAPPHQLCCLVRCSAYHICNTPNALW